MDRSAMTQDVRTEKLSVPEWGGHVFIRVITGSERNRLPELLGMKGDQPPDDIYARWAALLLCDEKGAKTFDIKSESDLAFLGERNSIALERVCIAGQKLNGLKDDAVEEAEKN